MQLNIFYLISAISYFVSSFFTYFKYKSNKDYNFYILIPWLLHAVSIILTWKNGIYFGFAHSLSIMSWTGVGLYLLEKKHPNMKSMEFGMLILNAILVLLPLWFTGTKISLAEQNNLVFMLHFITMNFTYGIVFWICLHIGIIKTLENHLHNPNSNLSKYITNFPPLMHMHKILIQRLNILWLCMTFVILTGLYLYLSEDIKHITHKIIFAIISWLTFSWFLWKKKTSGINSKKTTYYLVYIFILWILAYIGSHFILEVFIKDNS